MTRERAMLGVPLLLTLHNAEEALFVRGALAAVAARAPEIEHRLPDARTMYVALAVATVVSWTVWMLARRHRAAVAVLVLLQCIVLANVAWHVTAAVALRGYAPGLVTAVALNLPFSLYFLRRTFRERWIGRRTLVLLLPIAVLLHAAPVMILLGFR